MKLLKLGVFVLSGMSALAAQAEMPVQIEPQLGVYLTQYFGSAAAAPAEFGMKFHYGDIHQNIHNRTAPGYRPAMLDLRFNHTGMTALNVSGVNTLMPSYVLRQEEEGGGIFDSINWGLVGMAALGGGIYYASENYRDDREEDRERANAAGSGGGGGGGGDAGGGGATPISGMCLPGDPTGMLCAP